MESYTTFLETPANFKNNKLKNIKNIKNIKIIKLNGGDNSIKQTPVLKLLNRIKKKTNSQTITPYTTSNFSKSLYENAPIKLNQSYIPLSNIDNSKVSEYSSKSPENLSISGFSGINRNIGEYDSKSSNFKNIYKYNNTSDQFKSNMNKKSMMSEKLYQNKFNNNFSGKNVYNAVEKNNIIKLEKLYNKYKNNGWNWKDKDDVSPIILASMIGNVEIILELLLHQNNIDINYNDKYGYTALMYSVINNNEDIVKVLLNAKNIDIDKVDLKGNSALLIGCSKNSINTIQILLNKGANFLLKNQNALNPLSFNNESSKIVENYIIKIMSDYTTFKKYFEKFLNKNYSKIKLIFDNFINNLYNNGFMKNDICKSSLFYGFILRFAQSYKPFLQKNELDKNILLNYLSLINTFEEFLYTKCKLSSFNINKINKSFTPLIDTIKNDIKSKGINDQYISTNNKNYLSKNLVKEKIPIFNKAKTTPAEMIKKTPIFLKKNLISQKAQTLPVSPKLIKYKTFNQYKRNISGLSSYNYKSRSKKLVDLAGSYLDSKFNTRNKCIAKDQLLQISKFPKNKVSKINKDFIDAHYRIGMKTIRCK
jgi:ankyrin repeat protein